MELLRVPLIAAACCSLLAVLGLALLGAGPLIHKGDSLRAAITSLDSRTFTGSSELQ